MKLLYTLILLPIFLYSGAYYDLCNGKEYTVGKNKFINYSHKDQKTPPFALFITCGSKDMNITGPKKNALPLIFDINGTKYELHLQPATKPTARRCIPFGDKHYLSKESKTYWRKCRRSPTDWPSA